MAANTLYVRPRDAVDILDAFQSLVPIAIDSGKAVLTFVTNVPHVQLSIEGPPSTFETNEQFSEFRTRLAKHPSVFLTEAVARRDNSHPQIHYRSTESGLGEITFTNLPDAETSLRTVQHFEDSLNATSHAGVLSDILPQPAKGAVALLEQSLASLQSETANIARFSLEQQRRNDEYLRERVAALEEEYKTKAQHLDAQINTKEQALTKREESLKTRTEAFDLRQNTLVRRDRIKTIGQRLEGQEAFQLSKSTNRKRWFVHLCFLASLIVGALGLYFFGNKAVIASELQWMTYLPLSVSLVFFGGMLLYYIRWNDGWSQQHASAEIHNSKLLIDIERADWLAELLFEWQKSERAGEIPVELIRQFSLGLFESPDSTAAKHPVEDLRDIMRAIPHVKVDRDSVEIAGRKTS